MTQLLFYYQEEAEDIAATIVYKSTITTSNFFSLCRFAFEGLCKL